MPRYCLDIPDYLPWRLNDLMSVHWRVKHRRKREDKAIVATYAVQQEIPKATGPRRVELQFTLGPRNRIGDPDNWPKSILDALQSAGLIVDDSPEWCHESKMVFNRGERKRTVVILEDVP